MRFFEGNEEEGKEVLTKIANFFNQELIGGEEYSRSISPSMLSCEVATALKLQGVKPEPQKITFRSKSIPDHGTYRHNEIQDFLKRSGWWVSVEDYVKENSLPLQVVERNGNEVKLQSTEYPIRFMCDGVLRIDGVYYILEIKTEGQKNNSVRDAENPKHTPQILTYSWLLRIPKVLLIYEGRNDFTQKYFIVNVTKKQWSNHEEMIKRIVKNKDLPYLLKRDIGNCKYCRYKKACLNIIKTKGSSIN